MTHENDTPPARMVPPYAVPQPTPVDWGLFGRLSIALGVGTALYLAFALLLGDRIVQVFHDFKVVLPTSTQYVFWLNRMVLQGGFAVLVPAPPVIALVVTQIVPRSNDEAVRNRWRRRTTGLAIALMLIVAVAIAIAMIAPYIALINAVAGPAKK